ncbi:hypothetical protein CDD80_6880 [Ophiocordyceps camponoti-rufipedis]|uniref:N-acetyltransferase ESCO zinc-finger domain-containing protein n=1 Tax=Ophiocordyceps camponoti-rufipedis TaxID=2004952 RepID=A0A2C5ZLY9_9HYPO|nr:hypothetical protein CDD80_6880 [Ophiocordyceps camponoti-rufipedis]
MSGPPSRIRDRPLRTYGKRSASSNAPGEPPTKRQLIEAKDDVSPTPTTKPGSAPSVTHVTDQPAQANGKLSTRPSIRAYFKPVTRTKVEDSSKPDSYNEPSGSLRSSDAHERRRPRLLRLRPTASNTTAETPLQNRVKTPSDSHKAENRCSASPCAGGNCATQPTETERTAKPGTKSKRRRRPRVQTTLNLSTGGTFAECKVCNTVWNPLYPDDVSYHARRHAKVTAREKRKKDDGL